MKRFGFVSTAGVVATVISLTFFFAAGDDRFHVFQDGGDTWHVILSTSFLNSIPAGLLSAMLAAAALVCLPALFFRTRSNSGFMSRCSRSARCLLPLAVGMLLPLRYVEGIGSINSFIAVIYGPAMGALLTVALVASLVLMATAADTNGNDESRPLSSLSDRSTGWLIFVIMLAMYAVTTPFYAGQSVFGGDQPHYLIITHSLVDDGDIFIKDDHDSHIWQQWTPLPMEPQYFVRTTEDRIIPFHRIGLSILAMPFYAVLGKLGALLMMGLMAALAAANCYWLTMKIVDNRFAALWATAFVCLTIPALPLSYMFFSEGGALLITLIALNLIVRKNAEAPPRMPWLLPLLIWSLPWFHARDMITALALSAMLVWRMRSDRKSAVGIALVCAVLAGAIPLYNFYFYGTFSPVAEMGPGQGIAFAPMNVVNGLGGLLFDQEFGMLLYNPALVLAIIGLGVLARRRFEIAFWLFIIIGFSVGPNILYNMWWGGGSPPGRYYVAIIHLAAVPLAALLTANWFKRFRPIFYGMAIAGMLMAVTLLVENSLLVNIRNGISKMLSAISLNTIDAVEWWPSWIAGGSRAWPLAAALVLTISITTAIVFLAARWLKAGASLTGRAVATTAGISIFLLAGMVYAPISEAIVAGEPNLGRPVSHELDIIYQQRLVRGSHQFRAIDRTSQHELPIPPRRFSAFLLFPRESLEPDEISPRRRSLPIEADGRTLTLLRDDPFFAGEYDVRVVLRSETGTRSVAVTVENLGNSAESATRTVQLSDSAFTAVTLSLSISEHAPGLQIHIAPAAGRARYLYAAADPVSLATDKNTLSTDRSVWWMSKYRIIADQGALFPPQNDRFWIPGDSSGTLTLKSRDRFEAVHLQLRGRKGAEAKFSIPGMKTTVIWNGGKPLDLTVPVQPVEQETGEWLIQISYSVEGGFVPSHVQPDSTDNRYLGVQAEIELIEAR